MHSSIKSNKIVSQLLDDVAIDVGGSKVTVIYDPATTDRGSLRTSMASVGVLLQ